MLAARLGRRVNMRASPFEQLRKVCGIMAPNPRRAALLVLVRRGELPVEDLAAKVGLAFSPFKPHLKVLTTAGMIVVKGGMCRLGERVGPTRIDGRRGVRINNPDGSWMGYTGPDRK
jgi:hypothetical protein